MGFGVWKVVGKVDELFCDRAVGYHSHERMLFVGWSWGGYTGRDGTGRDGTGREGNGIRESNEILVKIVGNR
jgi:hypothetical protein